MSPPTATQLRLNVIIRGCAVLLTVGIVLATSVTSLGQFVEWNLAPPFVGDQHGIGELEPQAGIAVSNTGPSVVQGFIPRLEAIRFIRIVISHDNYRLAPTGMMVLNLRSGSHNGPLIATAGAPGLTVGGTNVVPTFFFPTNVIVQPGQPYFFELVVQTGTLPVDFVDLPSSIESTLYINGAKAYRGFYDLNFTEGVVSPAVSVTPVPRQGLLVSWDTSFDVLANMRYGVQRSTNLLDFIDLATNFPATPPLNVYWDRSATNRGPYFYRIKEE